MVVGGGEVYDRCDGMGELGMYIILYRISTDSGKRYKAFLCSRRLNRGERRQLLDYMGILVFWKLCRVTNTNLSPQLFLKRTQDTKALT